MGEEIDYRDAIINGEWVELPDDAICTHGFIHGYFDKRCPICDQIATLREENERLRAKALIWHKWPEEKPEKDGLYLVKTYGSYSIGDYYLKFNGWIVDERMSPITHWAEITRPKGDDND